LRSPCKNRAPAILEVPTPGDGSVNKLMLCVWLFYEKTELTSLEVQDIEYSFEETPCCVSCHTELTSLDCQDCRENPQKN